MFAKNENNENVDWWFIYKTAEHSGSADNEGYQYFYFDAASEQLVLSDNMLNAQKGALYYTLKEALESNDKDQGYIVYNDERTDGGDNEESKGHTKGVLTFNKAQNSAMFLLHSVPRFPSKSEVELPDEEKIYGQTFICITLADYQTANDIAAHMMQQQNPQILLSNSFLPENISPSESLSMLFHQTNINESVTPSKIEFKSQAGKQFQLIAKSKHWGKDFWIDLVGPTLDVSLDVETWRRGLVTKSEEKGIPEEIEDVIRVDLSAIGYETYHWSFTKDHSKWAVSCKDNKNLIDWVCVGDINRMVSQEKRGGGSICFQEPNLCKALQKIITVKKLEE